MLNLSKTKPRVLVVARMSPRLEARTRTLVRALSPAFDVDIVSESVDKRAAGVFNLDGGRLTEIVLPLQGRRFGHLAGLLRAAKLNLHGVGKALSGNYDIVTCSDGIYALAGILARLLRGRRFVYNAHEILWALGNPRWLSLALRWVEWLCLRTCDLWMVPSEARAEIMRKKHGLTKRYLVYENFPINRSGPGCREMYRRKLSQVGVPSARPILIFQGSLTWRRGLEQIIRAAKTGAFHLVVQGDGPLSGYLQKNIHEHMTLLEPCPNDEVVPWLSAADLSFVYYENDCLNSAYAASSKFYASVFAGTPIVCNRLPSFEAFAGSYGGVVFLESLEQGRVTECLSEVLSDTRRYEELRRQALSARQALEKLPYESRILETFLSLVVTR